MVQMRVDGTRKQPLTVVEHVAPSSNLARNANVRKSPFDTHIERVGSRAYWAMTVSIYVLFLALSVGCGWIGTDAVMPMIQWPYNASASFLNSTDVIYIYGDNSLGQFMAPLLPRLVSPVPAWAAILIQGDSIQFLVVCVFLYEAIAAVARLHVYKRRATFTQNAHRFVDLALSLLGGINLVIAFFAVICVLVAVLFLQTDSTTGYTTTQTFMSSIADNDVPLIEGRYGCVLEAGRNTTLNMTTTTTTEASDYDYWVYEIVDDCATILYEDVAYIVKLKMLLLIFTSLVTLILAPILARGDHRLAVEMRMNPIFKVETPTTVTP